MSPMSIRVILKSGAEFVIKCTKFSLNRNALGGVTGYEVNGISENMPVFIDFDQVAAIVRIFSDEKED